MHGVLRSGETDAVGEAGQGGVHDELGGAGVDFEGGDEARGNGHYDRGEDHEWRVVAKGARAGAVDERADGGADDDGEHHVAAFGGRIPTDDLVVRRQIIFEHVASAVRAHDENESGDDGAVLDDSRREGGGATSTELVIDKGGEKDGKGDERADHSAAVPGILGPGPRECEKEAGQRGEEEQVAQQVELRELLLERHAGDVAGWPRVRETAHGQQKRDDTDGRVDVKTPPPAERLSESATEERRGEGRHPFNTAHPANEHGPPAQSYRLHEDDDAPGKKTSGAQPRDGPPHDKHGRRGSGAAEQRSSDRDGVGEQEDTLDGEERVRLAEEELESARAKPEDGRIPADVGDGVEVVRDARHGGGDDVHVYAAEDEHRADGEHDEPELGSGGVLWLCRCGGGIRYLVDGGLLRMPARAAGWTAMSIAICHAGQPGHCMTFSAFNLRYGERGHYRSRWCGGVRSRSPVRRNSREGRYCSVNISRVFILPLPVSSAIHFG